MVFEQSHHVIVIDPFRPFERDGFSVADQPEPRAESTGPDRAIASLDQAGDAFLRKPVDTRDGSAVHTIQTPSRTDPKIAARVLQQLRHPGDLRLASPFRHAK